MKKNFVQIIDEIRGKKILVANRGIPARRIVRSISEIFKAIPVVTATDIDKTAPFTSGAQELFLLGSDHRAYLDVDKIIRMAKARDIVAIHPGWGFASEDDTFPDKCEQAGILFIGPPAKGMHILGNKVQVRQLAQKVGVPVVPGSDGAVTLNEARKCIEKIGLPVMLKAEGGGGGRGIYEIYTEEELESAFSKASALAQASFGNPRLFVERLLTSIRHIEIQVIADRYGNVFAFDERDCTVQRNHQKLIEITPSPWPLMTPQLRKQLKDYAKKLIQAVDYHSLATVEFLVNEQGSPYLIEVNTRLQVEHGITECRYGVDLVEEQIAVAFGAELRLNDETTPPYLHAMQVRINCEDPQQNFSPNSGRITRYLSPGGQGVRVDSCVSGGYEFPSQYDSAASLLITYGKSWEKILAIMERALREYTISGIKTTIPFHRQVIANPTFRSGDYNTNFIGMTAELLHYWDKEPESIRLSHLIAEISAKGYNPYLQLGEYRRQNDKALGRFEPSLPRIEPEYCSSPYPRYDRDATLSYIRDSDHIHFTDTSTRDNTQSNSSNRFRLAEDRLVGPYLDNCGFFSIENGGGAHFHVAMMANMTYPFFEAQEWNNFAPNTLKQLLIRSTNILGYKPQPKNVMQKTGEMICEHYDVIRCFDFLNHIENMRPFAEIVMNSKKNIFEPAISLTQAAGFDIKHYLQVVEEILAMVKSVSGFTDKQTERSIILGLKDMAGMCSPTFIRELVTAIRKKYPELLLHYHRHYTDGLFVPAVGAAALAGTQILDVSMGATVRSYGQGEVLSTAAYLEELGLKTNLNKDMIRSCNFVFKQIMPYYDRYVAPYFQGIDYDVTRHGMPGGATSSSQEGAMKQGYIHLLPYMLKFLAGTRQIIRYHDVTPGSQITWNTAFLAVTGAFKQGGLQAVRHLLHILETVINTPEDELSDENKQKRLIIYQNSNDAFRNLLLGKYGRLPLGFPPEWVYESAFGAEYKEDMATRTEESPLQNLPPVKLESERRQLAATLRRDPTEEEFVLYLNHPGDALKTINFQSKFGDPNQLPLDVWFEGLQAGESLLFKDSTGRLHQMTILNISPVDTNGISEVRYCLNSEFFTRQVQIQAASEHAKSDLEKADPNNPYHIGSPSNGDLWVTHVKVGDMVKKGEEVCNVSIMKQEKAVLAPIDGRVKRVLKTAAYQTDKIMVAVKEQELLIELEPPRKTCPNCNQAATADNATFCAFCGQKI